MKEKINFKKFPDKNGRFGKYGGRFVAETLMPLLLDVEKQYAKAKSSKDFKKSKNLFLGAGFYEWSKYYGTFEALKMLVFF